MTPSFFIFGVQVLFSFFAFSFIFQKFLIPALRSRPDSHYFLGCLIPHVFRHLGFTGLLPEVTDPTIPFLFSYTLAIGDFATLILVYASIRFLSAQNKTARLILWIFSVVGIVHLTAVIIIALWLRVPNYQLGFVWIIATFYAPSLWISHLYIVKKLISGDSVPT